MASETGTPLSGNTAPTPGPPAPAGFDSACRVLADPTGNTPLWECPCAECVRLDLELYSPELPVT